MIYKLVYSCMSIMFFFQTNKFFLLFCLIGLASAPVEPIGERKSSGAFEIPKQANLPRI